MTQYFDPSGWISSSVAASSYIDTRNPAPSKFGWYSAEEEIAYALSQNPTWKREANAQFAILPAPGTTYEEGFTGFCAYHSYDAQHSVLLVVPYAGDEPFSTEDACQSYYGRGDAAKATSLMASHEYAEAATNPIWNTEPAWENLEGYENGDICSTPYDELPNGAYVQGTYDDHQSRCSLADESPPHVLGLTESAVDVTEHAAHIRGTVNPEGSETSYYFEYGTTTSYGSKAPSEPTTIGSDWSNHSVEAVISGLTRDQAYHYRVVAENASGVTYGEDRVAYPSRWQIKTAPRGSEWGQDEIAGVSCLSQEFCMAVGGKYDLSYYPIAEVNRFLAYRLAGGELHEDVVPEENLAWPGFGGVDCTSEESCVAVGGGYSTTLERWVPVEGRWNGASWSTTTISLPPGAVEGGLDSVACAGPSHCFAVGWQVQKGGAHENLGYEWDGTSWSVTPVPSYEGSVAARLTSVSCSAATNCVAVGYYGTGPGPSKPEIARWDGETWAFQGPAATTGALWSVSCPTSGFCMTVDLYGKIERWNGSAWSEVTPASTPDVNGAGLEAVSCAAETSCVLTGYGVSKVNGAAVTLAEAWNGSNWTEQNTPRQSETVGNGLNAVACPGVNSCMAAGSGYLYGSKQSIIETREMPLIPAFSKTIGAGGSEPGEFNFPRGIAVEPSGGFWVADGSNNRLEKFSATGEFLLQSGSAGTGPGQFNTPVDIAVTAGGDLWVTDALNSRVEEFNSSGEYLGQFGSYGAEAGQFIEPSGIAVDATGNIWVTDHRYSRVEEFNSKGEYIRTASFHPSAPEGIAIDGAGHLWVADAGANDIAELSSTGGLIQQFGSYGPAPGQFEEPGLIAIRPTGELLIADRAGRIQEFSAESGEFLTEFADLSEPGGLAVSEGGVIYASNSLYMNRVERWAESPMAITGSASSVSSTGATVDGVVNPGGRATQYEVEYGPTTAYGSVAEGKSEAGSGSSEVSVSVELTGLEESTTYHYRLRASNGNAAADGKDRTFTTNQNIPSQLAAMSVTEPFDGSSTSLASFSSSWAVLGWAGGSTPKGEDTTGGWRPWNAYPTVNGAGYTPTVSNTGSGIADVVTMSANPGIEHRYFSLWSDMGSPSSPRSGYELRFTYLSAGHYSVALSKWLEGSQSTLATQSVSGFENGDSLAIVDAGETVSAWTDTGSGFVELTSAPDATFDSGRGAVQGAGNLTRLTNFKMGSL